MASSRPSTSSPPRRPPPRQTPLSPSCLTPSRYFSPASSPESQTPPPPPPWYFSMRPSTSSSPRRPPPPPPPSRTPTPPPPPSPTPTPPPPSQTSEPGQTPQPLSTQALTSSSMTITPSMTTSEKQLLKEKSTNLVLLTLVAGLFFAPIVVPSDPMIQTRMICFRKTCFSVTYLIVSSFFGIGLDRCLSKLTWLVIGTSTAISSTLIFLRLGFLVAVAANSNWAPITPLTVIVVCACVRFFQYIQYKYNPPRMVPGERTRPRTRQMGTHRPTSQLAAFLQKGTHRPTSQLAAFLQNRTGA